MDDSVAKLKSDLNRISQRIYSIKNLIERESDLREKKRLEKELKEMQYQALFYIEKLRNEKSNSREEF